MHRQRGLWPSRKNVNNAERWGSVLLGLTLLGCGLWRRSLAGMGGAAAGAMLLERGLTGRCPAYGRLGLSSR